MEETIGSQATTLCTSCGLCCTGHLFVWVKLKPSELDPAEEMGMHVYRSDPTQRGFGQPCPLWKGQCTIYHSTHYPRACRAYQCKLLKDMLRENVSLSQALVAVHQAKDMIQQLNPMLPASESHNFRERMVAHYEHPPESARQENSYQEFRLKADALLLFYEEVFGVTNLIE